MADDQLIIKIVVDVEKLKKAGQIQYNCSVCGASFSNSSCLTVHYVKVHQGGPLQKKQGVYQYYCPVEGCQYNLEAGKKHFPAMKNLTQHYRKVHAEKIFKCDKCDKSFGTEGFRQQHSQTCGYIMVCNFCEAEYNSREALLTHIARKHAKQKAMVVKKPVVLEQRPRGLLRLAPKLPSMSTSSCQTSVATSTPVMPAKVQKLTTDTQTETAPVNMPAKEVADVIEEAIASLRETTPAQITPPLTTTDNASQTLDDYFAEYFKTNTIGSQTETAMQSQFGRGDPMLYSQHTQTCEEIMDETINPILKNIDDFEFATNQTQTNWNMEDFLLVSTETQTSFSSCFLNSSHTQTTEFLADDRGVGEGGDI